MSPQQLNSLLTPIVQDNGISLQINQSGSHLVLVLNRPVGIIDIDYSKLADQIVSTIVESGPKEIKTIRFYAREKGSKQMDWQEQRTVIENSSMPIKSNSAVKVTHSAEESRFQKAFQRFRLVQETVSAISLLGILGILLLNSLTGQKVQQATWEYKIESVPDLEFQETINELGSDGWELASARRALDSITDEANYEIIFKRKKN